MPEIPDVTVYVEAIRDRTLGTKLTGVRLSSPFVLRSVEPPLAEAFGRRVQGIERLGKRIVIALEGDLFLVTHLMIAGRFRWLTAGAKVPGRLGLAAFDFEKGTLVLTEAGTKKRASLRVVKGRDALREIDPGGLEVQQATLAAFREAIARERHTLKRTLTDPTILSGIGNAYSDEILHRAKLSPTTMSTSLDAAGSKRLYEATRAVLDEWTARLRDEAAGDFPGKVTAFREGMAVHGRYGKPCPVCGTQVQRIRYADNETDYCPTCQTGGRLLADRSLSRLLKQDWPKTLEELEAKKRGG